MPNETISQNDRARLTVQWGKPGEDLDPAIILTSWKAGLLPDGQIGEWNPASAWDLDRAGIDHLIRTLRKAREQAFSTAADPDALGKAIRDEVASWPQHDTEA
jgi:hypothetical protein